MTTSAITGRLNSGGIVRPSSLGVMRKPDVLFVPVPRSWYTYGWLGRRLWISSYARGWKMKTAKKKKMSSWIVHATR